MVASPVFWATVLASIAGVSQGAVAAWTPPPEYALFASKDGHYFTTSDGKPFFWQADTAWFLFHRLTFDEADEYLADRASKGFNIVQAIGAHPDNTKEPNALGDTSWVNNDPFRPNEAHWEHVDAVMQRAWQEYGIRIALHAAWGKYSHDSEGKPGFLDVKSSRSFGEYIGKRYPYVPKLIFGDINPWWKNKSEPTRDYAYGGLRSGIVPQEYKLLDFRPIYNALAEGFVAGEKTALGRIWGRPNKAGLRYVPMISMHPTNQWFADGPTALSSSFFGDRSWLSFDTAQSGHSDYPPNPPLPWWSARRGWEPAELMYAVGETQKGKKRPALDNEPHYEWRYNNAKSWNPTWNASDIRKGNWQTAFTGMAGISYGCNPVWLFTSERYTAGGGGPMIHWREAAQLPGAGQVQWVQKAILDRNPKTYFDRVPAQDIIVGNPGISDARIAATRDSKGSWLMVYSPNTTISIDTSSLKGCDVSASWLSPVTGEYLPFPYEQCRGDKIKTFELPVAEDHLDWTLVLERKQ